MQHWSSLFFVGGHSLFKCAFSHESQQKGSTSIRQVPVLQLANLQAFWGTTYLYIVFWISLPSQERDCLKPVVNSVYLWRYIAFGFWKGILFQFNGCLPVFASRATTWTPCAPPNLWTIQDTCQLLAYDPRGGLGRTFGGQNPGALGV